MRTELLARATGIARATALGTVALDHSVNGVVMFAFAALLPALLPVPRWMAVVVWLGMIGAVTLVLTFLWLAKHPESLPSGRIANAVARARSGLMAARNPRAVAQAAMFSAFAIALHAIQLLPTLVMGGLMATNFRKPVPAVPPAGAQEA